MPNAIAHAIEAFLGDRAGFEGTVDHLRHSVQAARPQPDLVASPTRDYTSILASALALGQHGPAAGIAQALTALAQPLPWHYSYKPQPGVADLSDRIAFAELVGPGGPLFAPACRVGFTLMAPQTFYPLHAHPAVELYLVIAGHAEWTIPGAGRIVPPGAFVLHPTNEPHAMRSFAEPLLALYSWSGDIDTGPFYL